MSRKTNHSDSVNNNHTKDSFYFGMIIIGLCTLLAAIFLGVFGVAGKAVTNFFVGIFGYAVYAYTIAGILFGLFKILKGKSTANWKLKLMLFAALFLVVGMCHMYTAKPVQPMTYGSYLSYCFKNATTMGGLIGGMIFYSLGKFYIPSIVFMCLFFAADLAMIIVTLVDKDFTIRRTTSSRIISKKANKVVVNDITEVVKSSSVSIGKDLNNTDIYGKHLPEKFTKPFAKTKGEFSTIDEYFADDSDEFYGNVESNSKPQKVINNSYISDEELADLKHDTGKDKLEEIIRNYAQSDIKSDDKPVIKQDENDYRYSEYSTNNREQLINRDLRFVSYDRKSVVDFDPITDTKKPINEPPISASTSTYGYEPKDKDENQFFDEIVENIDDDSVEKDYFQENYNKVDNNVTEKSVNDVIESKVQEDIIEEGFTKHFDSEIKSYETKKEIPPIKKIEVEEVIEDNSFTNKVEPNEKVEITEEKSIKEIEEQPITVKPKFVVPDLKSQKPVQRVEPPIKDVEVEEEVPYVKYPYVAPKLDLLNDYDSTTTTQANWEIARKLEEKLHALKIDSAKVEDIVVGPRFTRYEVSVSQQVKTEIFNNLDKDIQKSLASLYPVNITSPIPGKDLIGFEVANTVSSTVGLKEILLSKDFNRTKNDGLYFALGKDINNTYYVVDVADFPHAIVAGATGSGKSVCLNVMLISLLYKYSPEQLRLIIVDPKMVEFMPYAGIPHLMLEEAIVEAPKAIKALEWSCEEMDNRFKTISKARCANINQYNALMTEKNRPILPYLLLILDEYGDLMTDKIYSKQIELLIKKLGQKSRAAGIHVILATQRPNVKTITGDIKGNAIARLAFQVAQRVDSSIILDSTGAENLLGNGDMIYKGRTTPPMRLQCAFISTPEVYAVTEYIKQHNKPVDSSPLADYLEKQEEAKIREIKEMEKPKTDNNVEREKTIRRVLDYLVDCEYASVNGLRKQFDFGHPKASKILDILIKRNFVESTVENQTKGRKVLITRTEFEELYKDFDKTVGNDSEEEEDGDFDD